MDETVQGAVPGPTTSPTALVVEDEPKIRRFLRMALEAEGWTVCEAETLRRGILDARARRPDLVVLDLGLPDGDGNELIADLRSWSEVPVIVLSARAAEPDKVRALDAGADDYLVKPFGTAELFARVRAQMRRRARRSGGGEPVLQLGRVRVDFSRRTVERDGQPVHLTPIEFRLLACLAQNADTVLTHRQVLQNVWGPGHAADSHYVRVFMAQLRKKIEDDPSRPRHILTEAGVGYRFVPGAGD
jgi:two-component system KDP operon response regulator KdpE